MQRRGRLLINFIHHQNGRQKNSTKLLNLTNNTENDKRQIELDFGINNWIITTVLVYESHFPTWRTFYRIYGHFSSTLYSLQFLSLLIYYALAP